MASRRLDISSLLCNDEPQVSPLDVLVQAASEERKRLHDPRDEYHHHQRQQHQRQLSRDDYIAYDRRLTEEEERQLAFRRQQERERRAQHEHQQRQQHQQQLLLQLQREEDQRRAEYERQEVQRRLAHDERQRREAAEREVERQRYLEQQQQQHQQHQQQRERPQYRFPSSPVASYPSSISHLISHSPPISPSPLDQLGRLDGDDRPVKKRRHSNSPTRHEEHAQQQERIAKERDKMRVGELGYGRVIESSSQSPIAGPSSSLPPTASTGPRRPGSGHTQARKVAVADLLVDKEPQLLAIPSPPVVPSPDSREGDARKIISPVSSTNNRRSPPGSQIGRAKAARKSDEYVASLHPAKPSSSSSPSKSRPRQLSDEGRSSNGGDDQHPQPPSPTPPVAPPRQKKTQAPSPAQMHPPPTSHPSLRPPPSSAAKIQRQAQEDPHEWFIHQYDEVSPPDTKPPPHTPSPSLSPTTGNLVPGTTMGISAAALEALGMTGLTAHTNMSVAGSTSPHAKSHSKKSTTPQPSSTTPKDALDKELEDLLSETKPSTPTLPSSTPAPPIASTSSMPTTQKPPKPKQTKQRKSKVKNEMDLVVDLAVNELVDKMEEDENIPGHMAMDVDDVEDELLSLVDDRPQQPPSSLSTSTLTVTSSAGGRRPVGSTVPSHASLTPASSAQGVKPSSTSNTRPLTPIPLSLQPPSKRTASEAPHSSPLASTTILPLSSGSTSGKPDSSSMSIVRSTSERDSMPPPASTSGAGIVDRAASVVTPEPGSASTTVQTGGKKKKEPTAKGTSAKAKAAAAKAEKLEKEKEKSETAPTPTTTKPKGKGGAKSKKDKAASGADTAATSTDAKASTPPAVIPAKPKGGRKASGTAIAVASSSRSRSASVMRGATPAQESDAGKADEKEKEGAAEEEEAEDDNKLYCLCKTKYDESRFMIACDRCDEWYHTQCVEMPEKEVDLVDQFICPSCIEKNPQLSLRTTYKQRCLYGLKHPEPDSSDACRKAARGAFSKYCSEECGRKYMQGVINVWSSKGGKTEKLWETVKDAEKREGVVVCQVEEDMMDIDELTKVGLDESKLSKPKSTTARHKIVPPVKSRNALEHERLDGLLASLIADRDDMQREMEMVECRERLLQLAGERAELVGQCGWDQRLCCDDKELTEVAPSVWESYEDNEKKRQKEGEKGGKDEEHDAGSMDVDGNEEPWWCPGKKVCDRHSGWQTIRYKEVSKEKEIKEEALAKMAAREREIRTRIDVLLDPHGVNATPAITNGKTNTNNDPKESSVPPLTPSNTKLVNGHSKTTKAATGEKKGKKRKAPTS